MLVFQAFKFYMEQHVENIMKTSEDRRRRRQQLEKEMMRCDAKEYILGAAQEGTGKKLKFCFYRGGEGSDPILTLASWDKIHPPP